MESTKTGGDALEQFFNRTADLLQKQQEQIAVLAEQVQELVQAAEVHRDCIDKLAQLITTPPRTESRNVH